MSSESNTAAESHPGFAGTSAKHHRELGKTAHFPGSAAGMQRSSAGPLNRRWEQPVRSAAGEPEKQRTNNKCKLITIALSLILFHSERRYGLSLH